MHIDRTSATLLGRLRDRQDKSAWELFYQIYTPIILGYCRGKGCSPEMAQDVLQETLVSFLRRLDDFTYDSQRGRFRGLLISITESRLSDAFRREHRYQLMDAQDERGMGRLAEDDSDRQAVRAEWDQQFGMQVLRQALERVKARVRLATYMSFELTCLQNRPIEEVCVNLDLPANRVYQHRHRVQKLLEDEARAIMRDMGELE